MEAALTDAVLVMVEKMVGAFVRRADRTVFLKMKNVAVHNNSFITPKKAMTGITMKPIILLLAATSAIVMASPAFGQQRPTSSPDFPATKPSAAAPPDADEAEGDIVVTAQKREEKLRDVPASISVLGGARLENIGAGGLADYATYVPGLAVNSGGTPGKTTIVLRGISTGGGDGALIGTYLDDTPLGSSSGFGRSSSFSLDLLPYDIERLEVLRGPQGTLYGASSMGGLLKYVLRQADPNTFEARAGGLLESTASTARPTFSGRGAINLPIVAGTLAVRASGFYQDNAGWIDNPARGIRNENGSTQKGGRVALFWRPTDAITVKASALLQDIRSAGNAVVQLDAVTLQPTIDKYSRAHQLAEPYYQQLRYYSLAADWDVGFATVTSATSWSNTKNRAIVDESAIYAPFFQAFDPAAPADGLSAFYLDVRLKKFTQEVRVASPRDGRFEWLLGGFYTNERILNLESLTAQDLNGASIPSITPFATVYWPTTYREYSGFGDITVKFGRAFDITGGLRYSSNRQSYLQDLDGALFGGPQSKSAASRDNITTFSASARFRPNTTSTLYARVANGYRPGGPNVALPGIPPSFKSDRLVNYEAGYKASLLRGALDLELSAFYIDWTDIQINVIVGGITFPGNGSKASSRGFEASGNYHVTRALSVGANLSYTNAKLDADVPSLSGLKGDQLPGSPRWTSALTLDYSRPLRNDLTLLGGLAYRYRGSSLTALQSNSSALRVPEQNVVDAHLGVTIGQVTAQLYARNLLNDRSYTTYFDPDAGASANFVPIQPRTLGIMLDARF